MARFGDSGTFVYYQDGVVGSLDFININLGPSQMPVYPFGERRISDKTVYRNLNGAAYSYRNYTKAAYDFRFSMLDKTSADSLRLMFDANAPLTWNTNGTTWGTFIVGGDPTVTEVLHDLYDVEMTIEEM